MDHTTVRQLLSLNVALPRDVRWRGRTVRTAIYKEPVGDRRRVRRLNIDGDGQADLVGHGGEHRAVYAYDEASQRHWERVLGRSDLGPGSFGENFTVTGMPDDVVCIGDVYRVGAAVLEVTQPRVTCFKIGMRLGEPRMPSLMYSHGRPGFYLRVVEEGDVGAGDEIEQLAAGPGGVTVREACALLYLPGHDRERIADALAVAALPQGWRTAFRALLNGDSGLVATAPTAAWTGFRPFRVTQAVNESADVRSLVLEPQDGNALPEHAPGMSVAVRLPAAQRTYSLSSAPDPARYRISVKRLHGGVASAYLHDRVGVGDVIELGAPRGTFTLDAAGESPVAFVSAGIGVTPLLAMLEALARTGATRSVRWLQGARDAASLAFGAEVAALLALLPDARALTMLSHPRPGDRCDRHGRIDGAALATVEAPGDTEWFLCGPPGFMTDVAVALTELGVPSARVHREAFGPARANPEHPPHAPAGARGRGAVVSFARAGLDVPWDERFASLLELAEACDVPADWSCRTGVCHRCETALVDGTVDYEPEPLDAPAPGNVLLCSARPRGPVTLDI